MTNRKSVIILVYSAKAEGEPEVFGNFKKCCELRFLPYHSLKALKFPIEYDGMIIFKVPFN